MKIFWSIVVLVLCCSSCSEENSPESNSEIVENEAKKADTTFVQAPYKIEYDQELAGLIKKFDTINFKKSLNGDRIDSLPRNYGLKSSELNTLSQNFQKIGDFIVNDYYIKSVSKILDAKRKGKLDEYQESVDIGGTYTGNAFAMSRYKINDTTELLTTKIEWASYPACPSGSGTELLLTVIHDGKVAASTLIAYKNYGSDPPVFGESFLDYKMTSNRTIELKYHSRSGEYSDDGKDIIDHEASEKFELTLGQTIAISEIKEDK